MNRQASKHKKKVGHVVSLMAENVISNIVRNNWPCASATKKRSSAIYARKNRKNRMNSISAESVTNR